MPCHAMHGCTHRLIMAWHAQPHLNMLIDPSTKRVRSSKNMRTMASVQAYSSPSRRWQRRMQHQWRSAAADLTAFPFSFARQRASQPAQVAEPGGGSAPMWKSERQAIVSRSHTRTTRTSALSSHAMPWHAVVVRVRTQGRVLNHGDGWRQKKKRGRGSRSDGRK
jgi:hypothetical protein